ncbi:MAG: hypothetical protein UHD05_00840, partial [Ruminococcus sp.]|nr:hypothetical protein [Ruminococcus sp.]
MSTCKDCLHYDLCKEFTDYTEEFIASCEKNFEKYGDAKEKCEYFKDRSKSIDLPCKVGDTVWCINESQIIEEDKVYQIIVRQFSDINVNDVLLVKFGKASFEDFGKTVFLT